MENSFKFVDETLHRAFLKLLKQSEAKYRLGSNGVIHYAPDEEELIENELIAQIRDSVFPSWQVVSCPADWTERYIDYMRQHQVPFQEELIDAELSFLIPRAYRPHAWKLEEVGQRAS